MNIPKSFRVGTTRYRVQQITGVKYRGCCFYNARLIYLREDTPKRMEETFWHEAVHAVLHSMEHRLTRDERFVDTFSKRLYQLIQTARF